MINAQGWIEHPDFIRIDGIADKVYWQGNTGAGGLACHSIVGEEPDTQDGIPNRFLSTEKNADGSYTKNAAASCMFILRKRAKHVQMYPVTASTWTTGGREANTTTWPMEAEGGRIGNESEPLTEHQVRGFLAIARAWEARMGRKLEVGQTVREHRQIAIEFGYAPTACASGRYANAWAALSQAEPEPPLLERVIVALWAGAELADKPFAERLKYAMYRMTEAAEGRERSLRQQIENAQAHVHVISWDGTTGKPQEV